MNLGVIWTKVALDTKNLSKGVIKARELLSKSCESP